MKVSYLRGAYGMNRMDGENNENVYGRFDVCSKGEGINWSGSDSKM